MADLRNDHSWLEKELSAQLGTVSAPDTLWGAIHEQRRPLRVRPRLWMSWTNWPIATAALVTVLSAAVWRVGVSRSPGTVLDAMAARELRGLAKGTETAEVRSSDPREIRAWIRERSGIDVRLPEGSAPGNKAVQLIGARMSRLDKQPVAVITYKVDGDFAAMVVADTGSNRLPHVSPKTSSTKEMSLYSWSLDGDEYTIAFGGTQDSQRACLLCHVVPPAKQS